LLFDLPVTMTNRPLSAVQVSEFAKLTCTKKAEASLPFPYTELLCREWLSDPQRRPFIPAAPGAPAWFKLAS